MKNISTKLFSNIYNIMYLLSRIRKNVWVLSGKEKNTGEKLDIIIAGSVLTKNYISRLFLRELTDEKRIGKRAFWNILGEAGSGASGPSMLVMEIEREFSRYVDSKGAFLVPCWVTGEIDLSSNLTKVIKKNHGLKKNTKRILENGLYFEIKHDLKDFDNFYHNMYLPYVNKKYEEEAIVWTYEKMKREFKKCILLLIKKEDQEIAGNLINIREKQPRMWVMGIKDGNYEYIKEGAIHALYYYSFEYFLKNGAKRVNIGYTRGFLEDGVLQYKRQWGLKISGISKNYFYLRPLQKTPGLQAIFSYNPFIFECGGKLKDAIFESIEEIKEDEVLHRYKGRYLIPGIDEVCLFDYNNQQGKTKEWQREDLTFSIHNMDEIFPS